VKRSFHPLIDKLRVNRGIAWIGLASSLVGALDLGAQVILLHFFITKEDYGIAALATTLFTVLDQATDMGLSSAVIQRDDHSPEKISTVFWLSMLMSGALLLLLCTVAPVYARWQGYPVVGTMLIAYGGKLVFQNVYVIPMAMLKRGLRFKELSVVRVLANVAEFVGKIGFAAAGFHIWCLVLGPLMRVVVTGVGIQICHPWRPRLTFRLREAAAYARYGLKTSASQILFHIYTNVDYAVVNKFFGAAALGLYKAAYELVLEPVRVIALVVIDVAFPTFARLGTEEERPKLHEQLIAFTRQNLVVIVPFAAVILLAAEQALAVAWKSDYAVAASAARVLCVVAMLRSMSFVFPPLLDGIGKPSLTLIYTAFASVLLPALFVSFAWAFGSLGYLSVALAWAAGYPVAFAVLAVMALREIRLSPLAYLKRIGGIPACSVGAMAAGFAVRAITPQLADGPRLIVIASVTLLVLGVLLAYLQDISPRTVLRALRRT
jgi:O-antigen/teichoic acid export membrane protein